MTFDPCDPCGCDPAPLGLDEQNYRVTSLRILCEMLAAIEAGGGGGSSCTCVEDGAAVAPATTGGVVAGTDGANYQFLSVSTAGEINVNELPAAAALADDTANPTVSGISAYGMFFDGSDWDRVRGDSTDGLLVNLGANNDVTINASLIAEDTVVSSGQSGLPGLLHRQNLPTSTNADGDWGYGKQNEVGAQWVDPAHAVITQRSLVQPGSGITGSFGAAWAHGITIRIIQFYNTTDRDLLASTDNVYGFAYIPMNTLVVVDLGASGRCITGNISFATVGTAASTGNLYVQAIG